MRHNPTVKTIGGHEKSGEKPDGRSPERPTDSPPANSGSGESGLGTLSQWQLIRVRFARHRLALVGFQVLCVLYFVAVFAEFFAPTTKAWRDTDFIYCPPQIPKFNLREGFYVHPLERQVDPITLRSYYTIDRNAFVPLGFFVRGEPYGLWGLIPMDRHFIGVKQNAEAGGKADYPAQFFFLGADRYGHDIFSRTIYGSRISLSIGIVSILITFVLGILIGGISGYLSGKVDTVIQRAIEIINAFPQLPMWLALAAVMPADWSALGTHFWRD